MNFRIFRKTDKTAVIDLILTIQQKEFGVAISANDQPDLQQISTFYQSGKGNFWVAVDGGQVIGTIALLDIGGKQVALRKMFVAKTYRGPDKGVAKRLLDQCHQWALEQGVLGVYLGTIDVYQAAMRFYEKNGYQKIGKQDLPSSFPLIAVDNVFYQKQIQSIASRSH